MAEEEVAALVVDNDSGMYKATSAGDDALGAVDPSRCMCKAGFCR